jgi:isoleucyl-tRNA synthetase
MSKRLGNAIDPFKTLKEYGPDALRWYMLSNANPWDNLKFNLDGVTEVQRRFFGTLQNTYNFFALYANLDAFVYDKSKSVPVNERAELDQWIISKLQSLISEVEESMDNYDATKATRAIMNFTVDHLSNWYVRLARKRFWRGEMNADKQAAYETLYESLLTLTQLMSSFAPFYADWMYKNLTEANETGKPSVHLTDWLSADADLINTDLEVSMDLAQTISSLVHSLRKKEKLKVRQPLQRILIPVLTAKSQAQIAHVAELIKTEVNIKSIEYLDDTSGILVKNVKPNLPVLGKKLGPKMRFVVTAINSWGQAEITQIERDGKIMVTVEGEDIELLLEEVLITSQDIPGWSVASDQGVTVALDVTLTEELKQEGVARDLVNRIQNLRKDMGLEVQDKITISVSDSNALVNAAIANFGEYIQSETQALSLVLHGSLVDATLLDMDEFELAVKVEKA